MTDFTAKRQIVVDLRDHVQQGILFLFLLSPLF